MRPGGRPMPTLARANSAVPSRSMIDWIPFCPPDEPFSAQAQLAGGQVQVVMHDDHVLRSHLVVARQRRNRLAAGVHVGQRL